MATAYTAFARHRLVNEANLQYQDISANRSIVNGALFLQSMDAYGAISAGTQGRVAVKINGVTKAATANSTVSANQKKLLFAADYSVGHDATGKSSPAVYGEYFVNITFAGVYYGTVKVNSNGTDWGMGSLPTIPRHSSLNPIPAFSVPNNCSFSISRKSNFTHGLTFWIQNRTNPTLDNDSHWTYITNADNIATSGSFSFSTDNLKTIASRLNQFGGSLVGKVKLWTNGLSGLSQQRTVQINSPAGATPSLSDFTLRAGNKLTINLSGVNSNSKFTYDVVFKCAGYEKSFNNQRGSISFDLSQADVDGIQKGFTGATSNSGVVQATPKLEGVQYRGLNQDWFKAIVDSSLSSPQVSSGFTVVDSNSKSTNITNNNQVFIQNLSTLQVTVPSSALIARGFGILKKVDVAFGGVSKSLDYQSGNMIFDLGTVKTGNSFSPLTIRVTDSRGLTGTNNKTLTVYPFQPANIDASVLRRNNFESDTYIDGRITYTDTLPSSFNYSIKKVTFKTTRIEETDLTLTTSGQVGTLKIVPTIVSIDTADTEVVTITIYDTTGTISKNYNIGKGKPILFINSNIEGIAVGNLPGQAYDGVLPGIIELEAERYHTSGKTGIQMNNSDISGINGLWFSTDTTKNQDEGIFFINSGAESNVTSPDFYDSFCMIDGSIYINQKENPLFTIGSDGLPLQTRLWFGGAWMNPNQTANPSKALSKCRNGWVLVWAKQEGGNTFDSDIVFSIVHKSSLQHGTTYRRFVVPTTQNVSAYKALTITDTVISGSRDNSTGLGNGTSVLRGVYEW